jgi:hypothetical protein
MKKIIQIIMVGLVFACSMLQLDAMYGTTDAVIIDQWLRPDSVRSYSKDPEAWLGNNPSAKAGLHSYAPGLFARGLMQRYPDDGMWVKIGTAAFMLTDFFCVVCEADKEDAAIKIIWDNGEDIVDTYLNYSYQSCDCSCRRLGNEMIVKSVHFDYNSGDVISSLPVTRKIDIFTEQTLYRFPQYGVGGKIFKIDAGRNLKYWKHECEGKNFQELMYYAARMLLAPRNANNYHEISLDE